MDREEFPSISVKQDGPARHRLDGAREQDYIDEHNDRWTCVTDGVSRRWHRYRTQEQPALKLVRAATGA